MGRSAKVPSPPKPQKNKSIELIIGIPSGDHETTTFDVPYEEFKKYEGREPELYDRSYFYVGLYRVYRLPNCKALNKYNRNKKLIKIIYDDFGIKNIEDTNIEAKYIYDGYQDNEWFDL